MGSVVSKSDLTSVLPVSQALMSLECPEGKGKIVRPQDPEGRDGQEITYSDICGCLTLSEALLFLLVLPNSCDLTLPGLL